MWNTIVLCTVLRNAWVVECLGDSVPKLACAAEQALTRSHPTHSGTGRKKGFTEYAAVFKAEFFPCSSHMHLCALNTRMTRADVQRGQTATWKFDSFA